MKKLFSLFAAVLFAGSMMAATSMTCAEAAAAALGGSTAEAVVRGYVTSIAGAFSAKNKNVSFWMADTEDGGQVFEAYRAACETAEDVPTVGDLVEVTGTLAKFNSTPEMAQGCTFTVITPAAKPVNLGPKTIAEFLELKNAKDTCVLTGVITSVLKEDYGNLYLAENFDTLYVYGVLTPEGEAKKFNTLGADVTDTMTIKAVYGEYDGKPQAPNAVFVSVLKGPGVELDTITTAEAVAIAKTLEPAAGKSLSTAETYVVGGFVVKVKDAAKHTYFMSDDANTTYGDFQAYQCATIDSEVNVGDYVFVRGKIMTYHGTGNSGDYYNYEISGGTLVHGVAPEPTELDTLSVADAVTIALALENNESTTVNYAVRGYVAKIYEEYNEQHSNLSIYMTDDATSTFGDLQCRRASIDAEAAQALAPHDKVLIVGKLTNNFYNETNTAQIYQGKLTVEEEQAIEKILMNDSQIKKVIMNGVVYIVRDGKMFDLQGALVR